MTERMIMKKYYRLLLIGFFFFVIGNVFGQFGGHPVQDNARPRPTARICHNDILLARLRKDPRFRARESKMNADIRNFPVTPLSPVITLPVVVHIVSDSPSLITDAQVIAGIQLLNDAFSKSGIYSGSAGADTRIRFCLSQKDPDGGNTKGITRTTSFFSDHVNNDNEDGRLKNLVQWDPARYINIWLASDIKGEDYANFSCGQWTRMGEGGYGVMPPGGGPTDGIVITAFGTILAHEMGHYLGLYHTFQGGCSNFNCSLDGDMVCDTPPDNSVNPSPSCLSPENSCHTDTLSNYSNGSFHTDVPDQISNFMDYGNSGCSNEFTQGQADRMIAAVMTQRTGLLQNECIPPCPDSMTAAFTRDIAYSVIGNTITFTNHSSGAANFQWMVNDVLQSTAINFTYAPTSSGKTKITLRAFNTPGCFAAYTDYIITTCGTTARFYTDKQTIASKLGVYADSIAFTNDSYKGVTYQWLISNDKGMSEQQVGAATDLTYVFPTPANYMVRLVATNGSCSDTTDPYPVPVLDPTANGVPSNLTVVCFQPDKVQVNFCLEDLGIAPLPANTPVSFYDADPTLPGAHKLLPVFYLPVDAPGGNCISCFSHVLNTPYHGLERIYLVFNDSGTTAPLVLPNTKFQESSYTDNITTSQMVSTTINASICPGASYAGHTQPGTYVDVYRGVNGCDSTRTLFLTTKSKSFATIDTAICEGDSYLAGGHLQTTAGTYTDTLTNAVGCDSVLTTILTVHPQPKPDIGQDKHICSGDSLVLYPGNFVTYLWQDGSTHSTFTAKMQGTYDVTVSNAFGCLGSASMTIPYLDTLPATFLLPDSNVCKGNIVHIQLPNYRSYLWSTGSTLNFIDIINPGTYKVLVVDQNGCKGGDSIKIIFSDCPSVYIPNAFTPDGNGLNDMFKPILTAPVTNYHLLVFNRWGNRIFESSNSAGGWDGKLNGVDQPLGVYVFILTFTDINGIQERKSGPITLLR